MEKKTNSPIIKAMRPEVRKCYEKTFKERRKLLERLSKL
jgi:hypothetical protein